MVAILVENIYTKQSEPVWSFFRSAPQEHEQLSYSSTRTKAPSVIVSGLKPATWYVFSVRTRTATGYSSYSPKYEYETTGDCEYLVHLKQSTVYRSLLLQTISLTISLWLIWLWRKALWVILSQRIVVNWSTFVHKCIVIKALFYVFQIFEDALVL